MNIHDVVKQLTNGLRFTKKEIEHITDWLLAYKEFRNVTFEQLNEECWKDSDKIFNLIF